MTDSKTRRLASAAIFVLAVVIGSLATAAEDGPPPVPVTVARVGNAFVGATTTATGAVASRNDAAISAEVPGRLLWVAEPGTTVERGDVLARIEARDLELTLRDAQAAARRIEAEVRLLAAQRKRLSALGPSSVVSRAQLEEAVARHEMVVQQLEQARVSQDRAQLMLERTRIRAPFAGAVAERLQTSGEYVTPGMPLARLVDTRNVEVVARAPLHVAQGLRSGAVANMESGGITTRGKVRAVVPVGDERSRLLEVRLALTGVAWTVGTPVTVELPSTASSAGVSVPRDAVILRQANSYVFRVARDGTAERVPVKVSGGRGGAVEVTGGLQAGDRVVVRGGERLQPGQPVAVAEERLSLAGRS